MPKWEHNFLKIHEGCGGLVYWVEALETPGVGYFGKCRKCSVDRIPVEQMIPVNVIDFEDEPVEIASKVRSEKLEDLAWDQDSSWEKNQERLQEELRTAEVRGLER
ncbi:hypothetical protein [Haloplanus natans]|uniref:hypothetical protein n=1 Tax=Haloplanus natans TaxID=376171 RepID=UPI0006776D87|nr:hypothetical protein [Haloplanus natans]